MISADSYSTARNLLPSFGELLGKAMHSGRPGCCSHLSARCTDAVCILRGIVWTGHKNLFSNPSFWDKLGATR